MHRLFLVVVILSFAAHSQRVVAQTSTEARSQPVENARKLCQQGVDLMEAGQLSEAVSTLRQALQFDPEYAAAYAALGRTYFKMREWQQASDNLKRAAILNSKQRNAHKSTVASHITPEQTQASGPTREISPNLAASNSANLEPVSTSKQAKPLVSANDTTASTINLRKLLTPLPEPPEEIKTAAAPSQSTGTDSHIDMAPQVNEVKPAQPDSVATQTAPVDENRDQPDQTPFGARVADPVTPPPVNETDATETIPVARPTETSLTKIYRVGPNDVLDIRLNDSSAQKSTLYTVTAAGLLEHPLLSEPISVAGLTVEEIGSLIETDLQKRALIENAKAVVGVRDYASHTVIVSGLVKDSGTKVLRREAIPLYVVIADAQPLPEAAKVIVVRGGDANEIHDIDLNQPADMNFLVRSGDVINVRPGATQFIYIGGEIKFPGEKRFRRGLTLMQVILAAGGLGPKAKLAEIARGDDKGFLAPTRFKLKEIVSGKAADPLLEPGDRISILR